MRCVWGFLRLGAAVLADTPRHSSDGNDGVRNSGPGHSSTQFCLKTKLDKAQPEAHPRPTCCVVSVSLLLLQVNVCGQMVTGQFLSYSVCFLNEYLLSLKIWGIILVLKIIYVCRNLVL